MSPESLSNGEKEVRKWSVLDGEFKAASLALYQSRLSEIEKNAYDLWGRGELANRFIVAEVVELALSTCQPELFDGKDPEREKAIRKDIGSSAYACCSYDTAKTDRIAEMVSDVPAEKMPALKALETVLLNSSIFLAEGKDLSAVSRTTILHILAKQTGRESQLPKAGYNDD